LHQDQAHAGRRLHHAGCRHCAAALAPGPLRHQARQASRAADEIRRAHLLAPGLHRGAYALGKGDAKIGLDPITTARMATAEISTKPYLLRALYEWCVDNGYTPHLAVKVDSRSQVPSEYVRNGEITLNVSPSAVHKLQMGNELIEFSAPVACVYALYARETGHGMTFDVDSTKPAIQIDAEKETGKPGPSNEAGPALPAPAATPTEPTKPTGGKP